MSKKTLLILGVVALLVLIFWDKISAWFHSQSSTSPTASTGTNPNSSTDWTGLATAVGTGLASALQSNAAPADITQQPAPGGTATTPPATTPLADALPSVHEQRVQAAQQRQQQARQKEHDRLVAAQQRRDAAAAQRAANQQARQLAAAEHRAQLAARTAGTGGLQSASSHTPGQTIAPTVVRSAPQHAPNVRTIPRNN